MSLEYCSWTSTPLAGQRTLGAGDSVLRDLVRRTERVLRSRTSSFRYGGEFCILLPRTGYHGSPWLIAERIRQTIAARRFTTPAHSLHREHRRGPVRQIRRSHADVPA